VIVSIWILIAKDKTMHIELYRELIETSKHSPSTAMQVLEDKAPDEYYLNGEK
jgi:hypothetical protein